VQVAGAGATGNLVRGNYIGTDASGALDLGNTGDGVFISGAPGNTVGGTVAGARNVISGNDQEGVQIYDTAAAGNLVQGNYIGTDQTGATGLGNGLDGVFINGSPTNTIGGVTAAARNVISDNYIGVNISGVFSTANLVQGNYIGTDVAGTANLGNLFDGIRITGSAASNSVGGTASGAGNTIHFNGGNGVRIDSGTGNAILGNSIHSNTELGTDLANDGADTNDAGDADTGANNKQNYPVVAAAESGSTYVQGTLNSTASTAFRLEFFSSPACDVSGKGEGKIFLGATSATTNGSGNTSFAAVFSTTAPIGDQVTATATDPSNNTSEFSACRQVTVGTDADGDGILNPSDNCPTIPNANQADADSDGIGNLCDTETGIAGVADCGDGFDNDGDGNIDDADSGCLSDTDGDGITNASDNCPLVANPGQQDTDGDGTGDACEAVFRFRGDSAVDFNGDGRTDYAVWRPSNGTWYVRGIATQQWGAAGDIPVPGDYNGDGRTDYAVWRPSNGTWYVRSIATQQWGISGDIPVPGDYNGDGKTDFAVWRPSNGTWYVGKVATQQWGVATDIPVPGDYNGDRRTDFAVWRASNGTWYVRGIATHQWGFSGDVAVPDDYSGDRKTDFAVWRPSNRTWYVRKIATQQWGVATDFAVPGDYNGDRKTDFAVWRPSNGTWYVRSIGTQQWGVATDIAIGGR
jgi:hypothetical protein